MRIWRFRVLVHVCRALVYAGWMIFASEGCRLLKLTNGSSRILIFAVSTNDELTLQRRSEGHLPSRALASTLLGALAQGHGCRAPLPHVQGPMQPPEAHSDAAPIRLPDDVQLNNTCIAVLLGLLSRTETWEGGRVDMLRRYH
eukprot:5987515-Pleurochrysis_carterae.AAC.1